MNSIAEQRLVHQCLVASRQPSPPSVVAWLGGVQAQDERGAAWSIGLRLPAATEVDIARRIMAGAIVRTWAMRGALHYLAAADARWIVAVLAPGIIAGNRRRYRQLGLDEDTFTQSNRIIEHALADARLLTRGELTQALQDAGVDASGQRAPFLLQRASLDGVICQGPLREGVPAFALQRDCLPAGELPSREAALGELAWRYFASHGPATWRDFAWWSGLPAEAVKIARARTGTRLVDETIDGAEVWSAPAEAHPSPPSPAHLLPAFDELLLGYRDRRASLAPAHVRQVNAGGGMPKPTIVLDGRVIGTWRRSDRSATTEVHLTTFNALDATKERLVEEAVGRYGAFLGRAVVARW